MRTNQMGDKLGLMPSRPRSPGVWPSADCLSKMLNALQKFALAGMDEPVAPRHLDPKKKEARGACKKSTLFA
jgi:hypothetical protein